MNNWCSTHPCDYGRGGKVCMNCGTPRGEQVPAPVVPAVTSAPDFVELVRPLVEACEPKATNPKDAVGATKLPVSWVPTAVNRYAALAFAEGALKYGRYNWRVSGVRMSIYLDALHRHLMKLQDGEWCDGDSLGPDPVTGEPQGTQVPHLGSIIACAGIILDSWECDKLTDDRPPANPQTSTDMESRIEHMKHLKKLFAAFNPVHYTIGDAPREG